MSNNINSNNNNRNNNNNDQNSNQFNTNLGNTNNVQMAGGMAMSGRRLPALARLWDIRDKFKRKIERQLSTKVEGQEHEDGISSSQVSSETNLQVASHVLEQLYQQEIERKKTDRVALHGNVTSLFYHLYEQQKKEGRSKRQDCFSSTEQSTVISKVSSVGLSFVELWTFYHTSKFVDQSFSEKLCKLLKDAGEMGKVTKLVAETIKAHFLYLIDKKVTCWDKYKVD